MIERTNAFKVGDRSFLTLADAQKHELLVLFDTGKIAVGMDFIDFILNNKTKIVDILTITPTSKVRARKVHGGTKKRAVLGVVPNIPVGPVSQ